jgi:hypothetical protein
MTTSAARWSRGVIALHWLSAAGLALVFALGLAAPATGIDAARKFDLYQTHKALGSPTSWRSPTSSAHGRSPRSWGSTSRRRSSISSSTATRFSLACGRVGMGGRFRAGSR